jgi:hypothetical protein
VELRCWCLLTFSTANCSFWERRLCLF